MQMDKRALCAFDDKRFILEDGVHTLAYGHEQITALTEDVEEEESPNEIVLSHEEATRYKHRNHEGDEEPPFPDGEVPQAATARAQVLERFTSRRARPTSLPDPIADRIIFFARYNRAPIQPVEGLSEHIVRALKAVAHYELGRNTSEDEIRGTIRGIIDSLQLEVEGNIQSEELAPIERILEFMHSD